MKLTYFFYSFFFILPHLFSQSFQDLLKDHLDSFYPLWMHERLNLDFSSLANKKITLDDLKHFENSITSENEYAMVTIYNNKISIRPFLNSTALSHTKERVKNFTSALTKILALKPLPLIKFIIYFGDGVHKSEPVPVFSFAKDQSAKNVILIPDHEALSGLGSFYRTIKDHDISYSNKQDLAFWRGATTGGDFTPENWTTFPRSQAVLFSLKNPSLLDAKYVFVVGSHKDLLHKLLTHKQALAPFAKIEDHLKYKFLLDIDGNSCTYSRLHWILYSRSLCLKHQSSLEQWYYTGLKPYIHYIPFVDFQNLKETILWAKNHDSQCEQITNNATTFVKNNLTIFPALAYLYHVLKTYVTYQTF